ncbi:hypothetical protein Tco_0992914 [Tanacetum coccineum]|uniref:Uncharacterized protein n=1 Tax=Tanacetum coccineum TaxID=301880 RepID=A0ABQ5F3V4_9ASTR
MLEGPSRPRRSFTVAVVVVFLILSDLELGFFVFEMGVETGKTALRLQIIGFVGTVGIVVVKVGIVGIVVEVDVGDFSIIRIVKFGLVGIVLEVDVGDFNLLLFTPYSPDLAYELLGKDCPIHLLGALVALYGVPRGSSSVNRREE